MIKAATAMPGRHRTFIVAAFLAVAAATATAQFPPASSYRLLDMGAVPAGTQCPCIRDAFRVPEFVPEPYGGGPAEPLETESLSPKTRETAVRAYLEDRRTLVMTAERALAGRDDAFGVAMHMWLRASLAEVPDPELEEQTTRWFHLAAQQGHADAFVRLAYRYRHGRGVPNDDGAAAYWMGQGAVRGEILAMVGLGLTYATGRGVPQDWSAALYWWRRAAPKSALAARFVGDAYVCGFGVERDYGRAVKIYVEAAKRGEVTASTRLGDLYADQCVAGPPDAAIKAYTRAADQGYPDAQVALSDLLREGRGTVPDPYTAYRFARLAERRLPDGELKALAADRARAAAAYLPEFLMADADKLVDSLLAAAAAR